MPIRYKPAPYAVFNKLMNGPEMQEMLRKVAERGAAYARSIAPEYTGEYKASFGVQVRSHGGVKGDRAEAKIVNSSPHAAHVEWEDNYHVLNRTAAALRSL